LPTHPSKSIIGTEGKELEGKRIALCVTGSVAAVQSPEIARALMRHGAEVFAVMSPMAGKIINAQLMEWATGNEVITELTGKIEHVALVGEHALKVDLVLVAPATANSISKIACGIDDTTVTSVVSTAFGSSCPIIIVPAMHESMYNHPVLAKNIRDLMALGVEFVGPRLEEGKAKIAETNDIIQTAIGKLARRNDFHGIKVLITAGATIEHIDPVRIITNKSSGKMGVALADEASSRGADITFIYGTGSESPPTKVHMLRVETTEQMHEAVVCELKSKKYDLMIAVAAVADWTLDKPYSHKISSRDTRLLELRLKPTGKIIDLVKEISPKTFLVAFRAESNRSEKGLIDNAYRRLVEAKADLIVVNDIGKKNVGFGTDTNEVFIVDKEKNTKHIPLAKKYEVAQKILDVVIAKIKPK